VTRQAPRQIPLPRQQRISAAREVLRHYRVGIFIVTFNAEPFIDGVLQRIPEELRDHFAEIYIIDDSSTDDTVRVAVDAGRRLTYSNLQVLRTPFNRGYGGNQKVGYLHAIKRGLDFVILLHGDGQYPPEYLPHILLALSNGDVDAVIASRMMHRLDALRGHMPLYKWIGNQVLTAVQNFLLGSQLSEFHSGYRAYRVEFLKSVRFQLNSNDFHFDTEVLIQLIATKRRIAEIPVPTFYGNEISHVNGFEYAFNCLKAVVKYHLTQLGLFYQPNFDFRLFEQKSYYLKSAGNSLHRFVLDRKWDKTWRMADLGANDGEISALLAEQVSHVTSVDVRLPTRAGAAEPLALDLNSEFDRVLGERAFDCVLALDVIEHLGDPDEGVQRIFKILKPGGRLYASTGNIAFWVLRFGLLLGQFNYGKRGILDLTHARLFTIYSFRKLLISYGFQVEAVHYFGPPIADMVGRGKLLLALDALSAALARWWPSLFAYSFLVVGRRTDDLEDIYERTATSAKR
jgi:glycosyltransferase involved in cell wall biosynthesis